MADVFTKKKRSEVMAAIRSKGNKDTELKLAAILRFYKISGWRRHQPLPGKPDFVFQKAKLAVFIDGCFWHGCPKHGRNPKSNLEYWDAKLARNKARDFQVTKQLRRLNWRVIRLWEHELVKHFALQRRLRRILSKKLTSSLRTSSNSVQIKI